MVGAYMYWTSTTTMQLPHRSAPLSSQTAAAAFGSTVGVASAMWLTLFLGGAESRCLGE